MRLWLWEEEDTLGEEEEKEDDEEKQEQERKWEQQLHQICYIMHFQVAVLFFI